MKISLGNAGRYVAVKAALKAQALAGKYEGMPRQRALMFASAGVTFGLLACSEVAMADGWAGMAEKGAEQGSRIQKAFAKLFQIGGFVAGGIGAWNWYKKGSEGDRSDIKPKQIFGPIMAGAALGGIGYIVDRTGETVGISPSEYGRI